MFFFLWHSSFSYDSGVGLTCGWVAAPAVIVQPDLGTAGPVAVAACKSNIWLYGWWCCYLYPLLFSNWSSLFSSLIRMPALTASLPAAAICCQFSRLLGWFRPPSCHVCNHLWNGLVVLQAWNPWQVHILRYTAVCMQLTNIKRYWNKFCTFYPFFNFLKYNIWKRFNVFGLC